MSRKLKINQTKKGQFERSDFFKISDDTWILSFFNSMDSMSGLPFDLCNEFSVAAGIIEKGTKSKAHAHPHIAQLTFVLWGSIRMNIKEPQKETYSLELNRYEAELSPKGTIIQYDNTLGEVDCEVLYIVGPPYLYWVDDKGAVLYEDAIILDENWEELRNKEWKPIISMPTLEKRKEAFEALKLLSRR